MERLLQPATHERVKFFKALQDHKARSQTGLYLLEGARLVRDAMLSAAPIALLMVRVGNEGKYRDVIEYVQLSGGQGFVGDDRALERACSTKTPQGVCAAVLMPKDLHHVSGRYILALDHVKDPGNMGTILRTAQAFGASCAVLSPGCCDPFAPKCVRSAMGAHFKLHIAFAEDLPALLFDYKVNRGYTVIGGHLNGHSAMPELNKNRICVIGGEANGMEEATALSCSALYRIPMPGKAESLNAAVAAGILMFQLFS